LGRPLARVLHEDELLGPRGPDGKLTIEVPSAWLADERWIELDLPRTLVCARCDGGGCDGCGRSGAVDTRGRKELGEIVEVKLPASERGAVLRLPKRGGLPLSAEDALDRGLLLLTVVPGNDVSRFVRAREEEELAIPEEKLGEIATSTPKPLALPPWWLVGVAVALVLSLLYVLAR
jgi:hypothetical protein